jgi:glycosyltransferase involved in cell wall biosynthesis
MYPSTGTPYNGMFIKEQVDALRGQHECVIIVIERYFVRLNVRQIIKMIITNTALKDKEEGCGVHRVNYPVFKLFDKPLHILNGLLSCQATLRYLKKISFKPDLIHAYKSFPAGYVGWKLKRRYKCPVLISEFQGPFESYFNEPYRGNRVLKTIESVDRVSYSEFQVSKIKGHGTKKARFSNICFGVNEHKFNIIEDSFRRREGDIKKGLFKLIAIGRVEKAKGIDVLIKSIAEVRKVYPGIVLNIYGPATEESSEILSLISMLDINENIHYHGPLEHSSLKDVVNEHDILISASLIETLGLTLIEALACGKPVVSTKSGGPQEILTEDVGVLVEPSDVASLANGIKEVIAHYDRYDPYKIRAYMLSNFSQKIVTEKLNQLYKALKEKTVCAG